MAVTSCDASTISIRLNDGTSFRLHIVRHNTSCTRCTLDLVTVVDSLVSTPIQRLPLAYAVFSIRERKPALLSRMRQCISHSNFVRKTWIVLCDMTNTYARLDEE